MKNADYKMLVYTINKEIVVPLNKDVEKKNPTERLSEQVKQKNCVLKRAESYLKARTGSTARRLGLLQMNFFFHFH